MSNCCRAIYRRIAIGYWRHLAKHINQKVPNDDLEKLLDEDNILIGKITANFEDSEEFFWAVSDAQNERLKGFLSTDELDEHSRTMKMRNDLVGVMRKLCPEEAVSDVCMPAARQNLIASLLRIVEGIGCADDRVRGSTQIKDGVDSHVDVSDSVSAVAASTEAEKESKSPAIIDTSAESLKHGKSDKTELSGTSTTMTPDETPAPSESTALPAATEEASQVASPVVIAIAPSPVSAAPAPARVKEENKTERPHCQVHEAEVIFADLQDVAEFKQLFLPFEFLCKKLVNKSMSDASYTIQSSGRGLLLHAISQSKPLADLPDKYFAELASVGLDAQVKAEGTLNNMVSVANATVGGRERWREQASAHANFEIWG